MPFVLNVSLILAFMGVIILALGLSILFYPKEAKGLIEQWMKLPDDQFRIYGLLILIVATILIYLGITLG